MGTKKKFTPEELKHLQANPYTLRVTADSISYTLAFKEAFWALSLQGYTGTAAFRKLGYNTEVLGFERIHNTTKRIRREARSPEGFHEGARGGVRISGGGNNQTEGASAPSDEAARRMKREILCLQQQMAFLKKVMRLHGKPGLRLLLKLPFLEGSEDWDGSRSLPLIQKSLFALLRLHEEWPSNP